MYITNRANNLQLTRCFSCRQQLATSPPLAFEERTVQLPGLAAHLHGQGPQQHSQESP